MGLRLASIVAVCFKEALSLYASKVLKYIEKHHFVFALLNKWTMPLVSPSTSTLQTRYQYWNRKVFYLPVPTLVFKLQSTGCLVMKATKVVDSCKGQKLVLRPKTCGKSLLYIGHFDSLWPHWIQVIFITAFLCGFNFNNNWDILKNTHKILKNIVK